jgi:hypothetical protein
MSLIRIDRNPSRRQLALFGAVWLVVFAAWGGVAYWRGATSTAAAVWVVAILVPAIGWFIPPLMRIVYLGLAYLTFPLGAVLSFVVLAAVYFGVFTPIGLLMRWFGHDPMCRRRDAKATTYWVPRNPTTDVRRYFRQF